MGYRLWDDEENKLVVSRNVIFGVSVFPLHTPHLQTHKESSKDLFIADIPMPQVSDTNIMEVPENSDSYNEEFQEAQDGENENWQL